MQLHAIDLIIIGLYLASTVIIGILVKRRAAKNLDSYYLGGKSLPWYLLGLSNASGMFDISGTMLMVTWLFIYGMKSIWIPWLWPVFNQIFLMIYLSVWLRRSNVLTGAEWMRTRFGDDLGGMLSHSIIVLYAVIGVLGFLAYGFIGIGKFIEIFIPWEIVSAYVPFDVSPEFVPHLYGIAITTVATFYVILGGMLSIVWADVVQFSIMTFSAIVIGIIAMHTVSSAELLASVPDGWVNPFFGWSLELDWSNHIAQVMHKIDSDGYSLFGVFVMMMLFKGILLSAAGPLPNYDMQKILATRSPKEGALMSGFVSVILLPVRYFMIAGFTVLAVVFYNRLDLQVAGQIDFENILPAAINQFAPVGIMGLLLAGLLAAFMSTFASTVNAAPAYLVNDIYKRYINPRADSKRLIYASYIISILVVIVGAIIGIYVQSINSIVQWIVSGFYGGYVVSNVLKWYWWRFNGMGYFWGMLTGIICALIFPKIFSGMFPSIASDILPLYTFPLLLIISGFACVFGSLLTAPEDEKILKDFYRTVRPWGFWKPVHDKVAADDPGFTRNPNFKRDMLNVLVGVVAQTAITALSIFIVIKESGSILVSTVILVIAVIFLKFNWYNKLAERPEDEMARERG